ncbi:prolyl 4-hydroxylase subunit alpha-1-like [Ornithodoros turicata]|uniref:prolyl 4-hydroxylase subunit alpha-1-like n=1 Tax=Ornithodoros turicata TaxID=34597 RepID=UPI003139ABCC
MLLLLAKLHCKARKSMLSNRPVEKELGFMAGTISLFLVLHVLVPLGCAASTPTDLFTAVVHMIGLLKTEQEGTRFIFEFLRSEQDRLATADITLYFLHRQQPPLSTHPVIRYRSISRTINSLLNISGTVLSQQRRSLRGLQGAVITLELPTREDLIGAATGICRLQYFYNLTPEYLMSLRSASVPRAAPSDIMAVSSACFEIGHFSESSSWAKLVTPDLCAGETPWWSAAMVMLSNIAHSLGNKLDAVTLARKALLAPPETRTANVQALQRRQTSWWKIWQKKQKSKNRGDFENACLASMGGSFNSSPTLYCRMTTNDGNPNLLLRPIKMEVINADPRIVLFHDFINEREAIEIRKYSENRLKRAGYRGKSTTIVGPRRISKTSFMSDVAIPSARRIARRISYVTGLSLSTAEDFQVSHYGIGGHYVPHRDYWAEGTAKEELLAWGGNRLATVLIYLSDVTSGGSTAFLKAGVTVKPERGVAVFWYNMLRAQPSQKNAVENWTERRVGDPRTFHGACPVLKGSKWIMTKWLHEKDQGIVNYGTPN